MAVIATSQECYNLLVSAHLIHLSLLTCVYQHWRCDSFIVLCCCSVFLIMLFLLHETFFPNSCQVNSQLRSQFTILRNVAFHSFCLLQMRAVLPLLCSHSSLFTSIALFIYNYCTKFLVYILFNCILSCRSLVPWDRIFHTSLHCVFRIQSQIQKTVDM